MLPEALLSTLLGSAAFPFDASPVPAPRAIAAAPASCGAEMELVVGVHHEQVQRLCTDYRAPHCYAFLPGFAAREPRATSVSVCVDRYEWPNQPGAAPRVMIRFDEAGAECARVGKRLCTEFEWELACEGPAALPFPYGYVQEPEACNVARPYRPYGVGELDSPDAETRRRETARLYQAVPAGSRPRCRSPFGLYDLVGNVEEWVVRSRPEWPFPSALKGGYWTKPWAGCRGTNERHGPRFRFYQIGFRCCRDPGRTAGQSVG